MKDRNIFYAVNDKIYSHEVNGNRELFRKPELVRKWSLQMKSICFLSVVVLCKMQGFCISLRFVMYSMERKVFIFTTYARI